MKNKIWKNDKLASTSEIYINRPDIYEVFSQAEDYPGKISEYLKPKLQNKVVLDFGCGTGKFIPQFAQISEKYIATDVSDKQLEIAKEKAREFNNVEIIKTENDTLSLADNSVDVIFSAWVIGSIHDLNIRTKVLSELKRVLKQGGTIYLVENNTGGDFKDVVEGEEGSEKTQIKIDWLENNSFWVSKYIETNFIFNTIESAKNVFEAIWDKDVSEKIKSNVISHNIIILEYTPNQVLDSTKYVIANSEHVKVNTAKLENFVKSFKIQDGSHWLQDSPFDINSLNEEQKLMFAVVFNAISFSYWGEPYWNVEYKGTLYTRGSWSLVASIFRSIEEKRSLLDPYVLRDISKEQLSVILRGNTEIPLLEERVEILNRIGEVLINDYSGKFSNVVKESKGDILILLDIVLQSFRKSFEDSYEYKGKKVFFNKRAQALIESIHSIFEGKGYGSFKNIESLTALADYIIPNMLRNLGILQYSNKLTDLIDNKNLLEKGSVYEVEIRAGVVWVVEYIRRKLTKKGIHTSAKSINDYLWTIGGSAKTPFHRTRTTAY